MSERIVSRRKKEVSSNFANPLLVSPVSSTLASPIPAFASPQLDTISPQKAPFVDGNTQSVEEEISFFQSEGHDISRISLRPQTRLSVSQPNDRYEQEADWVASKVMSMTESSTLQPKFSACEQKEEEEIRRKTLDFIIQRDGNTLPEVPNYQLQPPSLLQPPNPYGGYGLGQNWQLQLDPQLQAMAMQYTLQQVSPTTIQPALTKINLGTLTTTGATSPGAGISPASAPNPFATSTPAPSSPLVPAGAGPDKPRKATAGDLFRAVIAVPSVDSTITSLGNQVGERVQQDWGRLRTGEQIGVVSSLVVIGGGALVGVISDPTSRQFALSQLNGRLLPVPGLNWLRLEMNTENDGLMLGLHVDVGRLLPPIWGFGPGSMSPIGGPPQPEPFVPGSPAIGRKAIQRKCTACEEEEEIQRKPSQELGGNSGADIESQLNATKGGGVALPASIRDFMEPRFGVDFSKTRVHTDSAAAQLNQNLNAQAFTYGNDIYFSSGKAPGNNELMAHELTHVVQQTENVQTLVGRTNSHSYHAGYQHAVKRLIQRVPDNPSGSATGGGATATPVQAATRTTLPTIAQAARDLTLHLAMPNPAAHAEAIFRTLLLVRGNADALRTEFQQAAGRNLDTALQEGLSGNDLIRAQRYLQYGTLRLADKIYFAVKGAGTDEDTLYRLMRQAHDELAQVDTDFRADYGNDYSADANLPNGQSSRVAGVLATEMSDWELDKAKALLAYGQLRPVDQIRIATNRVGRDEDMLFSALERCNRETVRAEYESSYENLNNLLDSELSGDDKTRADLILAGQLNAFEKIRLAVKGVGKDEQAIFNAISSAGAEERQQLQAQFNDRTSQLYQMLDDDLSSGDMERVRALLENGSSAIDLLRQAGAIDYSDIVDAIKMSSGSNFQTYKDAYNNDRSFQDYLRSNTRVVQYMAINTILNGTLEQRLQWAIEGIGTDEDYIFHVLQNFTDDASKQRISDNSQLMADLSSDLSTLDFGRVQDLLRRSNLSIEESVAAGDAQIERERSWLTDLFSNAGDALSDENRELHAALDRARADGQISPEEQEEIARLQAQTNASLEVYRTVRDELENTVSTILTTAAAVTIAVLSGGLASGASAAMIAAQLAQAALVSAVAKVVTMKIARGDRFDVFGADGAIAFSSGAIDGVMNVLGAPAAQALVGSALRTAGSTAAREAATAGFSGLGRRLLTSAVEGGIGGAAGGVFESAATENTWKQGFEAGITTVVINTGTGAATGAVISVGMHGAGEVYSGLHSGTSSGTPEVEGTAGSHPETKAPHTPKQAPTETNVPKTPEHTSTESQVPESGETHPTSKAETPTIEGSERVEVEQPSLDGQRQIQVTQDGRCKVCASPCDKIRKKYKEELDHRPDLAARISEIEASVNSKSNKARLYREIEQELADIRRTNRLNDEPARLRQEYQAELNDPANQNIKDRLDAAEKITDPALKQQELAQIQRELTALRHPGKQEAYHGPKPKYTNPGHHDPTSPDFRGGGSMTTPLPDDAASVYETAIPDEDGGSWYGQNANGEIYRYQRNGGNENDCVHWNGRENSPRGLKVPPYIKKRFQAMNNKE